MKEKRFNDSVEDLTVFVEKKIQNGKYKNIFIRDEGKILPGDETQSSTIFARYGSLSENEKSLTLFDGNIQKLNSSGDINIVKFEKTVLSFSALTTKSVREPKIQETSTFKIFSCMKNINKINTHNCGKSKKSLMDNKIEFNKRFGMPVYIPLISLICSFLLTSRKDKKIYSYNKFIYFSICFVVLLLSEILVRYSGISWNHSLIYYSIPITLIPLFYLGLIKKFKYENLN